jgi:hypothetical protein
MAFTHVPGFVVGQSGFHFDNRWDVGTTYPVITLPVFGSVAPGDASNGLCGGFVLAALDLFLHTPRLLPPPNTNAERPANGSVLLSYITQRLIDSWGVVGQGLQANVARTIEWIQTPDAPPIGSTLGRRVIDEEWPKIKADIDAGKPSPLSLVGGPPRGVLDVAGIVDSLHHCHQVLAYAYEVDSSNKLTLLVYDCNDPSNDNSAITLNLTDPAPVVSISAVAISSAMQGGIDVRGFFRTAYVLHDPSAIANGAGAKWDWLNMGKPATANIRASMGALTVMNTPASTQRPHVCFEGNDFNLWCHWFDGATWNWLNMGKPATANITAFVGAVTVMDTPSSAQRAHIFVTGSDGNLWCRWSDGGNWHWLNMGKPPSAHIRASMGAVSVMDTPTSAQRPHVFVEGNDFNLWCLWSDGANWQWLNMGKPATANITGLAGAVTVMDTPTSPQRAHVFVTGNDGNLWCRWSDGPNWHWLNMGKPPGANIRAAMGAVSVMDTPASGQRPHVFVEGHDGNLWCRWSDGPNWHWLNMEKPPGANIRTPLGAVTVMDTPNSPQRPHVFVEGNDFNLWCRWSDGANWSWLNMGKPQGANIRASLGAVKVMTTPTSQQRPYVFFEGDDYNSWCRYLDSGV